MNSIHVLSQSCHLKHKHRTLTFQSVWSNWDPHPPRAPLSAILCVYFETKCVPVLPWGLFPKLTCTVESWRYTFRWRILPQVCGAVLAWKVAVVFVSWWVFEAVLGLCSLLQNKNKWGKVMIRHGQGAMGLLWQFCLDTLSSFNSDGSNKRKDKIRLRRSEREFGNRK